MNIGLIGGGAWGNNLIREFNQLGVLNTICEINDNQIKKYNELYPNIQITKDFNDLLQSDKISAVVISLPSEMHYKFAKQVLLSNKDCYVEKPLTMDVAEAEELVKLAKDKNKILFVGHVFEHNPSFIKLKQIVDEGVIGKIKNIVSNRLYNRGFDLKKTHNVVWDLAPHDLSVVLSLCNGQLPNSVVCNGQISPSIGYEHIANSVLKYDDVYVNINVNWVHTHLERKFSVVGEKGMLLFDDCVKENNLTLFKKQEDSSVVKSFNIPVDLSESPLTKEVKHFVDCCANRTQPITDGEDGLRVVKVLAELNKSLAQRKEIFLPQIENKNKYFVHPTATVDKGAIIGEGTKIWHYTHIRENAKIGKNCNIGQNVYVENDAVIGDNCKVQNNVSIYTGVEAGDFVFFGPSCVLTNDIAPRNMAETWTIKKTKLETGVSLGANCTIVCGNTIGKHALIGAGAVICKDVEPYSIMVGNPGNKIGEIDQNGVRKLYKENNK